MASGTAAMVQTSPAGNTGKRALSRQNEETMTRITELLSQSTCALCGKGVHIDNHEGRVACDGCNMATDNCDCAPRDA
jgi:ribosomal protein S27AE